MIKLLYLVSLTLPKLEIIGRDCAQHSLFNLEARTRRRAQALFYRLDVHECDQENS